MARIAFARFRPAIGDVPLLGVSFGAGPLRDVEVHAASRSEVDGSTHVLLLAIVQLDQLPKITQRKAVIPDSPRRAAELAIETYARLVTLKTQSRYSLASPRQTIGLKPQSTQERAWLTTVDSIQSQDSMTAHPTIRMASLSDDALAGLDERIDGVALLADGLIGSASPGGLLGLFRVFERAFALPARKASGTLFEFLHPRFGYTRDELSAWASLRDRAAHADVRDDFVIAADIRPVIGRVAQAAYDVLLNKATWRTADCTRAERWIPEAWTESAAGDAVAVAGAPVPIQAFLLDEWGAYPISNGQVQLDGEWWLPSPGKKGALTPLRVVPRAEDVP